MALRAGSDGEAGLVFHSYGEEGFNGYFDVRNMLAYLIAVFRICTEGSEFSTTSVTACAMSPADQQNGMAPCCNNC